jgi:hypothetical protein
LSIALTIGNQSLQSSATSNFFPTSPTLFSQSPLTGSQHRMLPISHQRLLPPLSHQPRPCHPSATNAACHPSATNAGDSMAKKPDEGDPSDMETIVSLLKGLQTSLAALKQGVSTVKLDNSCLSVAVNRLQSEQLFDEKNLFKEETPDTDGEPNESSDSSQSSSNRTSSNLSRRSEKTHNNDGKSSKRPHGDGKHREEHRHHSRKGI